LYEEHQEVWNSFSSVGRGGYKRYVSVYSQPEDVKRGKEGRERGVQEGGEGERGHNRIKDTF
jgi:hypothetical protein